METNDTTLSPEELSALREAAPSEESTVAPEERSAAVKVVEYNFRQPGQLSSTQLRALNTVHEYFSKNMQSSRLSGVDIQLARLAVETVSFSSFIGSLSNPCFVVQLACDPNEIVLIDMDIPVARSLSTVMLGDLGGDEPGQTPLTSIEQSLAGGWVEKALPILADAWAMSTPVSFELKTIETDPRFIQVMPDETSVVVMTFHLTVGSVTGQFSICYQLEPLQPMLEGLSLRMTGEDGAPVDTSTNSERLLTSLKKVPFDMHAELGCSTLLANQLIRLSVGDVVCLDRNMDEPVDLYLGDRPVFRAQLGRKGDQLAVQVTGRVTEEE